MELIILTEKDLSRIVTRCVKKAIQESIPYVIQKANRKQWLSTDEVMEMLQCSRRHVQYLRDSRQLAFTQNRRTIRYNIEDVEVFLRGGKVKRFPE